MQTYRLRHRIRFQEPFETQDPVSGAAKISWQTAMANGKPLSSVPAEVLTGPGKEFIEAGAKQSDIAARINLRWFPGLKPQWRILWDGHVFDIKSWSTDITGRREWRLVCTAGASNGQ